MEDIQRNSFIRRKAISPWEVKIGKITSQSYPNLAEPITTTNEEAAESNLIEKSPTTAHKTSDVTSSQIATNMIHHSILNLQNNNTPATSKNIFEYINQHYVR